MTNNIAKNIFGRLEVIAVAVVFGRSVATCRCECGNEKAIRLDYLKSGLVVSCGCFHKEQSTTHGLTKSPHYSRWRQMIDRCENINCTFYTSYGGRGIKVFERWHDIKNFIADLPDGYWDGAQIDRINNDGDYEPGNIKWSTRSQNCDNRRTKRILTLNGKSQSLRRWAEESGINEGTLWERITVWGWSEEKALTTPPMTAHERMAKAHETRWAGHIKKPAPPAKIIRMVDYQGKSLTMKELSLITGISTKLLYKRIFERGWTVDRATK